MIQIHDCTVHLENKIYRLSCKYFILFQIRHICNERKSAQTNLYVYRITDYQITINELTFLRHIFDDIQNADPMKIIEKHLYISEIYQNEEDARNYCKNLNKTRLLGRRSHSLSQHTQFLKNNMIAENDFL